MTDLDKLQILNTLTAYQRLRATPVVDDDFPEVMERFDLEMARLARLVKGGA